MPTPVASKWEATAIYRHIGSQYIKHLFHICEGHLKKWKSNIGLLTDFWCKTYWILRNRCFYVMRLIGSFFVVTDFANKKIGMFNYSSILKPKYRQELEQLLFFNSAQHAAHSAIVDSIEMFGEPIVDIDGGRLRVNVKKLDEVQTLFVFDEDKLAGILVYSRVSHERIVAIHIAVHEDYSSSGRFAHKKLVLRMSQQMRKCARSIKGIKFIRMMYGNNRTRDYLVRKRSSWQSHQIPSLSVSSMRV